MYKHIYFYISTVYISLHVITYTHIFLYSSIHPQSVSTLTLTTNLQ
uniref:Uncharacterized protein n=1 Tax=Arundo donax TaxID=35708 RepID=A0A0A9H1I5_ARUDO